ncbi:flagellin [Catenovulum sp. SM1970]|uniref:flagellin N-terminal helical domain-containing protein n=1 Tax=Marinifaba aquimaris TaxID=2741323 RepID=UPI0015747513|nr:flagellin [Marinifaba aquimaris]NTS75348.1 flagellin [Marinifaba aquimaris]
MMNVGGISSSGGLLDQIQKKQEDNLEKLASGKKINKAADGAAAQQIIDQLTAESNAYQQSIRNSYDGVSVAQVADGALQGISQDTQRIRELTLQAGSGILSDGDRQAIQAEISGLQENIQSTVENTEFNGQSLFTQDGELSFQVGSGPGQTKSIDTSDLATQFDNLGLNSIDVTAPGGVDAALSSLDDISSLVGEQRGDLGATQNSFESIIGNLNTTNENVQAARSRLQDTDYAQATAERTQNDILSQSTISVASQANQQASQVLGLLQ